MVLIYRTRLVALAAGTLLFTGSTAMAAGPLLTADFDVNDPTFTYGYAYAQAAVPAASAERRRARGSAAPPASR